MRLFRCKCLGTEFSMYFENAETSIIKCQLKVLAHYIATGHTPYDERKLLNILYFLSDNDLLNQNRINSVIPFKSIKECKSRLEKNDEQ